MSAESEPDLSLEAWVQGEEEREEVRTWLRSLPPHVQLLIRLRPPWVCVRLNGSKGHYQINGYNPTEGGGVLVMLVHGRDSTLPGVAVHGIDPDETTLCCCGQWEPPTQAQIDAMKRGLPI